MITIEYCENTEMMKILKDGECAFDGNVWDFERGAVGVKKFLTKLGLEVELKIVEDSDIDW